MTLILDTRAHPNIREMRLSREWKMTMMKILQMKCLKAAFSPWRIKSSPRTCTRQTQHIKYNATCDQPYQIKFQEPLWEEIFSFVVKKNKNAQNCPFGASGLTWFFRVSFTFEMRLACYQCGGRGVSQFIFFTSYLIFYGLQLHAKFQNQYHSQS